MLRAEHTDIARVARGALGAAGCTGEVGSGLVIGAVVGGCGLLMIRRRKRGEMV